MQSYNRIQYLVRVCHSIPHLLKEKEVSRGASVDIPVLDCLRLVGPEKLDERPATTVLPHLRNESIKKLLSAVVFHVLHILQ